MNLRATAMATVLLLAASSPPLRPASAGELPRGGVAVHLLSGAGTPPWFGAALEGTMAGELSRFARVSLVDKQDARACQRGDRRCLAQLYRRAGATLVVTGTLEGMQLEYEILIARTGRSAAHGSIQLRYGMSGPALLQQIRNMLRPVVQSGGLLDEADAPQPDAERAPASAPTQALPIDLRVVSGALAGAIAFVLWPPLLLWLTLPRKSLLRRPAPRSWPWTFVLVALLGVVLALVQTGGRWTGTPWWGRLLPYVSAGLSVLAPLGAGALWGTFVLVNASWVLPRISGASRARAGALWPLVKAYLALVLLRAAFCLLYVPVLLAVLPLADAAHLDRSTWVRFVLPALGLLLQFWFFSLVDNLSVFLDDRLVVGAASARNAWHHTMRKYLVGYVRRGGVALPLSAVDQVLLLPTRRPLGVVSYGGGFARSRILVDERTRDLALGELPDEIEAPEREVNPEALPMGFLVPQGTERDARGERRMARAADAWRRRLANAPAAPRGPAPRKLGESATLLGWVVPRWVDETVPLISNTSEDFDVVRSLLTEHYAAFTRGADDGEPDDTDPSQRDFLFGALLREFGAILRRDNALATVGLSFQLAVPHASRAGMAVLEGLTEVYARFLSAPVARVADAYAALNQGLDHLIQHLYQLSFGDRARLTARGDAPLLYRTSKAILRELEQQPPVRYDAHLFRATSRNRLVWLSQLSYTPIAHARDRRFRMTAGAVAAGLLCLSVAWLVEDAVAYHPVYAERMRKAQAQNQPKEETASHGPP